MPVERDIDVALAARLAGLSLEEFKQLNPQMNQPVILAAGTPQVLLPYDNASTFVDNLSRYRGQLASWTAWVVPRTMRPADVAKELDVEESTLRDANRIPLRMLVKAGSTLIVPRAAHTARDVAEHIADNASIALAPDVPPVQRVAIKAARRGETVAAVARRTHTTTSQLAAWNKVSPSGRFAPGANIVMYLQPKAAQLALASEPEPEPVAKPVAAKGRAGKADDDDRGHARGGDKRAVASREAPQRTAAAKRPEAPQQRTVAKRAEVPERSAAAKPAAAPRAVAGRSASSMKVAEARESVRR
jgi:membrane-bound lytic murein transglycosylase D